MNALNGKDLQMHLPIVPERVFFKMYASGCLWISMDIYGYLCMSMDIYGYLWISMDIYDHFMSVASLSFSQSESAALSFYSGLQGRSHGIVCFDIYIHACMRVRHLPALLRCRTNGDGAFLLVQSFGLIYDLRSIVMPIG